MALCHGEIYLLELIAELGAIFMMELEHLLATQHLDLAQSILLQTLPTLIDGLICHEQFTFLTLALFLTQLPLFLAHSVFILLLMIHHNMMTIFPLSLPLLLPIQVFLLLIIHNLAQLHVEISRYHPWSMIPTMTIH